MDKADAAVLGQIQGLFRDTESFVIAAFQVQQHATPASAAPAAARVDPSMVF
jgi:hypothetical protein